ncbi:MAG: 3(2),5-bisphosphate nucleotidase CysQ [Aeromicrobium sp.]|nr:3(2),5-bisphosphate nucleotidase CysQ [Aeromicrobium sp.]
MSTLSDSVFAAELAEKAGVLLLELQRTSRLSGKELGKAGDAQANELLLELLKAERPDDAVLSEESADSPARLSADRVWIIDPLDGTREYGMEGRSDWAVHVALWERGASGSAITAAAVAQPALSTVYSAGTSTATRVERETPIFLMSASRPPAWGPDVVEAFGAESQPMGSAGAKAMAVLRGDADAYLHDGGQWEWDSAAPVGVALAAGLHASRVDGSTLTYNAAHPYLPDLLICRADLAGDLLAAIAAAS